MKSQKIQLAIVGGGVAGLWLYRTLLSRGFHPYLFEKTALGAGQTTASQGMIHGGQRYQLQGAANEHADRIAEMPAVWQACFGGTGPIDLSKVKILAENQYMWSSGGLMSGVAAFMASKAMNSKVKSLEKDELPLIFRDNKEFKGKVYRMDECVVDVKSLLSEIAGTDRNAILNSEVKRIEKTEFNTINLVTETNGKEAIFEADQVIFSAGLGNEIAIKNFSLDQEKPRSQRRPLKQVMVRAIEVPFYAHCITTDPRPRVTITAHPIGNDKFVWYMGGIVAEYGLGKTDKETIDFAKGELESLFPWLDWENKEWACVSVDRAEPYFDKSFFKSGPELLTEGNLGIAWPTKLTFAPALTNQVLQWLDSKDIKPTAVKNENENELRSHTTVPLSNYPWEDAEWIEA